MNEIVEENRGHSPVKRIDVHVGHGKTGSSYLQTALALSSAYLAEQGIDYPITDAEINLARRGVLTKGNFTHLDHLRDIKTKSEHLLLSSESLFHPLWSGRFGAEVRDLFPEAKVNVLLYVRNPVENAASSYTQAVEKGMNSKTFEEFLPRFNRPREVVQALVECKKWGFSYKIYNFSRDRSRLLETFADWLGCQPLKVPLNKVANRTLTVSEAEFLIRLSSKLPARATSRLGTMLCAKLPGIKADKPQVSEEAMHAFLMRMEEQVREANDFIGEHIYDLDSGEPYTSDARRREFSFSDEQLEIMAAVISDIWKKGLAAT